MRVERRTSEQRRPYNTMWRPHGTGRSIQARTKRMIALASIEGETIADLARAYAVSYSHCWKIARTWKQYGSR